MFAFRDTDGNGMEIVEQRWLAETGRLAGRAGAPPAP
jgi:hypothetical protein